MADLQGQILVETDWLAEHVQDPDLVVIDASWYPPSKERDTLAEYNQTRIPGAIFWDINQIRDTDHALPHMLPTPAQFEAHMKRLGIPGGKTYVIYDSKGVWTASRAWWVMTVMGVKQVAVLNGGLPKWQAEGRPVEGGEVTPAANIEFKPVMREELVLQKGDVLDLITRKAATVVDARGPAGFTGDVEEKNPDERYGHIPTARNVPDDDVVYENGTLKSKADLEAVMQAAGVDLDKPLVLTCLTGLTASLVGFALKARGYDDVRLYDGCWKEWQGDHDLPVETGKAD